MKYYYEAPYMLRLPMRMPVMIRLDGKAFHSWTSSLERPFDEGFMHSMAELAQYLCEEISGAQFAYTQSDEISIFTHNYKRLVSQAWFGNEIQKMSSISAGMASAWLTKKYGRIAVFDARCFILPESEVVNYFVWRQQDASRNSVAMLAQSKFSHKRLQGIHNEQMQEMLFSEHSINWNDLETYKKRGTAIFKSTNGFTIDFDSPIFTQDREYIAKFLEIKED